MKEIGDCARNWADKENGDAAAKRNKAQFGGVVLKLVYVVALRDNLNPAADKGKECS